MGLMINIVIVAVIVYFITRRLMPTSGVQSISTAQLKSRLKDKNTQFIDVRTPAEYKGNHISAFKNIPLHTITKKAGTLNKDKEVIVICQSGMRSSQASRTLKKMGFKQITNVRGGMNTWV